MTEIIALVDGRRLLVEFTCGRCGKVALEPYEHSSQFDIKSNVRCQHVPPDWTVASGCVPMLCDKCSGELQRFLDDGCRYCKEERMPDEQTLCNNT